MAFNPFDVFRRNQKILFACLTVMIMFMFTLQFGQGDFFSQVPRWLTRNRGGTGTVLAELNGSKVYSSQLEQTRGDRVLANQYMFAAASRAAESLSNYVKEGLGRASAENRPALEGALQAPQTMQLLNNPNIRNNPQMQMFAQQMQQNMMQSLNRVDAILSAKDPKTDDLQLAQAARLMINLTNQISNSRRAHYFENQANDTTRDVMDFVLWKKKADQIGIRLDDKAVVKLVNDEFFGKLTNDDLRTAEEAVRTKQGYTPADLRRALADEFRVRAAQSAVIGTQGLKAAGSIADAPYDYYQFYRDQTNSARYGLISVPADNYLDKVTAQPTESELLALFQKARNVEANPGLPAIGLKEPRRIKLGFVEVTGNEPFYKTKADATIKTTEALADAASPAFAAFAAVGGPAMLGGYEGPMKRQYAAYKREHGFQVSSDWGTATPFRGGRPLDTHVMEPVNVAAMTAAFAVAPGMLSAPSLLVADGYASDRIAKIESVLPNLIAPTGPGVAGLAGVLGSAAGYEAFIRPLPLAAVRGVLADRAREEVAKQSAADDMLTLSTDLGKPGVKQADAQARVETFAKERNLTVKGSADLRDQYMLASDPGLKPLEDKFQADAAASLGFRGGYIDPAFFSQRFFLEADPLGGSRPRPSTGLYKPQVYPENVLFRQPPAFPAFLVWRTTDVAAESPRTLDDPTKNLFGQTARDKTIAGWKRLKARELAKKDADELAKRTANLGNSSVEVEMKMRDEMAKLAGQFPTPEAKNRVQYHEIDRVAPLVNEVSFMPGRGSVGPFSLGPSALMPFPSQEIYDALIANRAKPLSTSAVVADRPGDRVYVATVVSKTENSADLFGLTVYGPTAQMPGNELAREVQFAHLLRVRQEIRDRAVSLLKAEFRYDKESDELNKRADQSSD